MLRHVRFVVFGIVASSPFATGSNTISNPAANSEWINNADITADGTRDPGLSVKVYLRKNTVDGPIGGYSGPLLGGEEVSDWNFNFEAPSTNWYTGTWFCVLMNHNTGGSETNLATKQFKTVTGEI